MMSYLRNAALSVFALVCLASASHAGDLSSGKLTATYLGPANTSANGGILDCSATTHCSFIRDGIVTPGQSHVSILVNALVDMAPLHVDIGAWFASRCGPDPTTPDLTGSGDLVLLTAGTWIIHLNTEDALPAGMTYSQKWAVSTGTGQNCGVSFCVNSVAGNPGAAPADCDQP
jgi:hypothetical protein